MATKRSLEQAKQVNDDLSFVNVELSAAKVIRDAKLARYLEG